MKFLTWLGATSGQNSTVMLPRVVSIVAVGAFAGVDITASFRKSRRGIIGGGRRFAECDPCAIWAAFIFSTKNTKEVKSTKFCFRGFRRGSGRVGAGRSGVCGRGGT